MKSFELFNLHPKGFEFMLNWHCIHWIFFSRFSRNPWKANLFVGDCNKSVEWKALFKKKTSMIIDRFAFLKDYLGRDPDSSWKFFYNWSTYGEYSVMAEFNVRPVMNLAKIEWNIYFYNAKKSSNKAFSTTNIFLLKHLVTNNLFNTLLTTFLHLKVASLNSFIVTISLPSNNIEEKLNKLNDNLRRKIFIHSKLSRTWDVFS